MSDQNIKQFKGEKNELDFTITDDDNNPIDLTSNVDNVYLVVGTGLKEFGEEKFEKTGTNLNASGEANFVINSSDTTDLTPGNYLYEVYVEYNGSSNYTAEVGRFFVKPRVDR